MPTEDSLAVTLSAKRPSRSLVKSGCVRGARLWFCQPLGRKISWRATSSRGLMAALARLWITMTWTLSAKSFLSWELRFGEYFQNQSRHARMLECAKRCGFIRSRLVSQ